MNMKKVNAVFVESHNEALAHIYRAIGAKKIAFSGLKLLHFDSHPDLGLPDIKCETIQSKPKVLLRHLSIENWILPSVFAGHIDHIIWMKPKWSKQLDECKASEFYIGEEKETKKLCVNVPESYFVYDGVFQPKSAMSNPVRFSLTVADVHEAHTSCRTCSDIVFSLLNQPFILDIDLDTFSTEDPFRTRFTTEQCRLIESLYGVPESAKGPWADEESAWKASMARRKQLSKLATWMKLIKKGEPVPQCEEAEQLYQLCEAVKGAETLVRLQQRNAARNGRSAQVLQEDTDEEEEEEEMEEEEVASGDVDADGETLDYLHYLWTGWDASDSLPHEVSEMSRVDSMIGEMESLLNRLHNPVLITVSRSSTDGYCPANQVDEIEAKVEKSLRRVYGEKILVINKAYRSDESQPDVNRTGDSASANTVAPPVPRHAAREWRPIRGKRGIV